MDQKQLVAAVVSDMEKYFGADARRIRHAHSVLDFARQINREEAADALVVECAAALHDIGIHEAERKYNSTAGNYQEQEGPPIALSILAGYPEISEADCQHIVKIIANHHSARDIDTREFRVLWDADWLVNIPDEVGLDDPGRVERCIERVFKTATGRRLAESLYLKR